jgi:hypothetical protein
MQQAKDLLTQEVFVKRRSNQKFANPQNRIRYNNKKAQRKRTAKAFVDGPLDRNRTILGRILNGKTELTISKDYLLGSGFTFNLYNYQKNEDGLIYSGIYEYGVAKLNETTYKIKKLQDG